MQWQHVAAAATVVGILFMACSGGQEPSEDEGSDFNGPGGGALPDAVELCENECVPIHPAGETDYRARRSCLLCDACYNVCNDEGVDLSACPDELEAANGCSNFHGTCDECINGMCALAYNQMTTEFSGVCAVQANTCAANIDCVGMNNCVNGCVETAPPPM